MLSMHAVACMHACCCLASLWVVSDVAVLVCKYRKLELHVYRGAGVVAPHFLVSIKLKVNRSSVLAACSIW